MENKKLVIDPKAAIPGQKYQKDKPWSCRYCFWWEKGGCREEKCHYLEKETKKKDKPHEPGNCKGCPYGKHMFQFQISNTITVAALLFPRTPRVRK